MNTPLRLTIFLLNSLCLNLLKRGKSISRILYRLAEKTVAIIHLGDSLPNRSSDLPESVSRPKAGIRADHSQNAFLFGLAPRGVYLAASVTRCAGALLPHRFTHHPHSPKYLGEPLAGLLSVALVVIGFQIPMPGRYPARCPVVFGLSSPENLLQILRSDCPTCPFSICQQSIKIIKQFEFPFFSANFSKIFWSYSIF